MGNIINVKEIANRYKEDIRNFTALREKNNLSNPTLATILVGEDDGSKYYLESQTKVAKSLNMGKVNICLPEDTSEDELIRNIKDLNNDKNVHGIMVLFPLPSHIDSKKVAASIDYKKDIDGVNPINLGLLLSGEKCFVANTAKSCEAIIMETLGDISGKKVVICGRSNIVGKPLALLMLKKNATVTIAHSKTKNLKELTKSADIVVCAIGRAHMFDESYFSEGQTVIDVGTSELDGKITGDVKTEEVVKIVENITSVPGGVGAITTSILMKNVCEASESES